MSDLRDAFLDAFAAHRFAYRIDRELFAELVDELISTTTDPRELAVLRQLSWRDFLARRARHLAPV